MCTIGQREQTVQRTAWFAVLVRAVERQQYREAGEALTSLRQLGVFVKFKRPQRDHSARGAHLPGNGVDDGR